HMDRAYGHFRRRSAGATADAGADLRRELGDPLMAVFEKVFSPLSTLGFSRAAETSLIIIG
ncbi:hypothetical protein, partial [Mesorhizobium sp. M2C.T.Ca.TU.002.02.1.1]|uniref:hypothetical protein n=1 Tax=Mesorhizobium sp. M2C.T.Ca.TU.002.02.1.1 TaxID=2496788 RepID=UPI0019D05A53